MDIVKHNKLAWDKYVDKKDRWTIPVTDEELVYFHYLNRSGFTDFLRHFKIRFATYNQYTRPYTVQFKKGI